MSTTVDEKVERTRTLWSEEVERVHAEVAQALADFEAASEEYERAITADEDTTASYNACMQALGRQDALKRRLARLTDPRELDERLANSRRLAERFS